MVSVVRIKETNHAPVPCLGTRMRISMRLRRILNKVMTFPILLVSATRQVIVVAVVVWISLFVAEIVRVPEPPSLMMLLQQLQLLLLLGVRERIRVTVSMRMYRMWRRPRLNRCCSRIRR